MDRWTAIRNAAADVLEQLRGDGTEPHGGGSGPYRLLQRIAADQGLSIVITPDLGENVLGELEPEDGYIRVRAGLDVGREHWIIAHELGHKILGHSPRPDTDSEIDQEPNGAHLVVKDGVYHAYSERDQWELEANIFAGELIAPFSAIRELVLSRPDWTVSGLASYFGLSRSAMLNRLADSLLVEPFHASASGPLDPERHLGEASAQPPALDDSQRRAVEIDAPALVLAGPGAGKTGVVSERFVYLVRQAVQPGRILALTFANKAADEMRSRIARALPEHAAAVHVSTFHSLGLHLLQEFGPNTGLRVPLQLMTELDVFVWLRSRLSELPLGSFENIHRPTLKLRAILQAISRLKDELIAPDEFEQLVQRWQADIDERSRSDADTESLDRERQDALVCADLAAIYRTCLGWMREAGYLDYGDLIVEAVRLLQKPDVAERIRERYDQILIDEVQDINYASGRLIHAIDGGRRIVWAVGDPRQSIFRFRGASPANLVGFAADYPGARILSLSWNYRSVEDIVMAGQAIAMPQLDESLARALSDLRSFRGRQSSDPAVEMLTADSPDAELTAILRRVEAHGGARCSEIAVLCRIRRQAQEVSSFLESHGIPTTWAGAVERRGDFKTLMGVLMLASDDLRGLVSLSRAPEHSFSAPELRHLIATGRDRGGSAQAALYAARDGEVEGLSVEAREKCETLRQLTGMLGHQPSPWHAIAFYLFEHSTWVRGLLTDSSPQARRRLHTLSQVADLAREFGTRTPTGGGDGARAFLEFLQSGLEMGELKLGVGFPAADAVNVLTVHASKGLEWPLVIVPNLAERRFPPQEGNTDIRLPPGLVHGEQVDPESVEEFCLFYVAVTRARDQLLLTRSERYGGKLNDYKPSRFLDPFIRMLDADGRLRQSGLTHSLAVEAVSLATEDVMRVDAAFPFRLLESYDRCPQKVLYTNVYGLHDEDRAYLQFRSALYAAMDWASAQAAAGVVPSAGAVAAELDDSWPEKGPCGHVYEAIYRRMALRVLSGFVDRLRPGIRLRLREQVMVPLGDWTVSLVVDEIAGEDRPVWRRHHFGHPSSDDGKGDLDVMYALAAERAGAVAETYYPLGGDPRPIEPSKRVRKNRFEKLIRLLESTRTGRFAPKPDDFQCSGCSFHFICPMEGLP